MSTAVKKENDKRKGMVKVVTYPATRACSIENGATKKIALKKINFFIFFLKFCNSELKFDRCLTSDCNVRLTLADHILGVRDPLCGPARVKTLLRFITCALPAT